MKFFAQLPAALCVSLLLGACDDGAKTAKQIKERVIGLLGGTETAAQLKEHEYRLEKLEYRLAALTAEKQHAADSFNSCVLDGIKGVTTDMVAQTVKEACIRTVEVPLPPVDILTLRSSATAAYGQFTKYPEDEFGLFISLNNKSPYTLTEMHITVKDKKTNESNTYITNLFLAPQTVGITAPTNHLPPGLRKFVVLIKERPKDNNFGEYYYWDIESVKGYIN